MGRTGKKLAPKKVYTPGSKPDLLKSPAGKSPKPKGRPKKVPVPSTERGKYKARYDEDKLAEALEQVKGGNMSERTAAKEFGVPRSTLKDRLAARVNSDKAGRPTVLSTTEEEILVQRLKYFSDWGYPLTASCLRRIIKAYLDHQGRTSRLQSISVKLKIKDEFFLSLTGTGTGTGAIRYRYRYPLFFFEHFLLAKYRY